MAVACQCLVLSAGFLSKGPTVLTEDLYETMCTLLCKVGVKGKLKGDVKGKLSSPRASVKSMGLSFRPGQCYLSTPPESIRKPDVF